MKLKKYIVKDINDALEKIKIELGKDAYILSTKKVKQKDKMDLVERDMLEVTAANDKPFIDNSMISSSLLKKKYMSSKAPIEDRNRIVKRMGKIDTLDQKLIPLKKEISEIKALLRRVGGDFEKNELEFTGVFMEYYLMLIENGVERGIAKKLINTLTYQVKADGVSDKELVKERLFKMLSAIISVPSPITFDETKKRVVVLVGPTGVGKTTTIAKLGSYFKLIKSKQVSLINIDSFRIGAEAQLKTYANLLNVPFFQIYSKSDLIYRLKRIDKDQLVFVDTAGRSANDSGSIKEMNSMLSLIPKEWKTTILVVSANIKSSDLYNTYKKYSLLGIDKMIFSKIDETMTYGNLFNLKVKTNIPAAYYTTGQRVPEDIEMAYPAKIASKLISNQW